MFVTAVMGDNWTLFFVVVPQKENIQTIILTLCVTILRTLKESGRAMLLAETV